MNLPPIVSPQEWEAAREELLVKEKELSLGDLFEGRHQLIVYGRPSRGTR